MNSTSNLRAACLSSIALFVAIVALRILVAAYAPDSLAGFSPLVAVVLCLSMVPVRPVMWVVPAFAYLVSDVFISARIYDSAPSVLFLVANTFFMFLLVCGGRALGDRLKRFAPALFATATGVIVAYLLLNTLSWIGNPGYVKSLAGWWQSQTVGLPGFPPSLTFLRNSLIGNLGFTACFVAVAHYFPSGESVSSAAPSRQSAS